jgi:uncharacterized SAM-binding protein YcdF (DUF218 family)
MTTERKSPRRCSRVLLYGSLGLSAALVVGLIGIAIHIWTFDADWVADPPLDAAVVLGAAAPAGTPSPVFAARLDYAETLFRTGAVQVVIVTGGGRADPTQPEAVAGVRYLLSKGLPANRVLSETRSWSTPENLCFGAAVGSANQLASYAIVSDPLHLARAMRYAADLHLHARPAATPYTRYVSLQSRLAFLLRETYLYAKRLLTGEVRCPT